MSNVYLAEHTLMRRRVAIKVLPRHRVRDSSYLARFRREAEAAAQLDHPNIVRAYDIDHEGDVHYFIMEYIDGRDFLRIVREDGPLEFRKAADYVAQVAEGLEHAHAAGLIHRDIKPGNCLVDRNEVVKLLDMGLAKFSQDTGPSLTLMHDENVLGTADYLSPEQARNSHEVDSRADIYSLGCTMHFLLTGRPPFAKGTLSERLMMHQTQPPPSIYKVRQDAPREVVEVCQEMMIKRADRRIQTAGEVAARLRQWLTKTTGDDSDSRVPTGSRRLAGDQRATPPKATQRSRSGPPKPPSRPAAPAAHGESDLNLAPLSEIGSSSSPAPGKPAAAKSATPAVTLVKPASIRGGSQDGKVPNPEQRSSAGKATTTPAKKTATPANVSQPPKRQASTSAPPPAQSPASGPPTERGSTSDKADVPPTPAPAKVRRDLPPVNVAATPELFDADLFDLSHETSSPLAIAGSSGMGHSMPWWAWAGMAVGGLAILVLVLLAALG